ncbi:MAG TPA: hypothetical protein VEK76_01005 [Candidatus Binatia bacterium]|nr:hypothetical protein [Candidatus Binatia bacterium]
MTIIRLVNGSDAAVKLTVEETLAALRSGGSQDDFVELAGEEGPVYLRPSGVIAVFGDTHRGSAGFRVSVAEEAAG